MLVGETVSEAESNARVVFRKLRLVRWVTKVQLHMYALSLFPDPAWKASEVWKQGWFQIFDVVLHVDPCTLTPLLISLTSETLF